MLTAVSGVHRVGLALTEGGGRRLRFTASDRDSGSGVPWCHVDAYDDVPLNTALRTGQPVLGSLEDLRHRYAAFIERQHRTPTLALAAIPIGTTGQVLGGYVLFFDRPQRFDGPQRRELVRIGGDLGAALTALRRAAEQPPIPPFVEPVPQGVAVATHAVSRDPAAVAESRRFLRNVLEGWGIDPEYVDAAVLCLSEVVTNAVVHAHAGCRVRVVWDREVLSTTVRDSGVRDVSPAEALQDPLRVHGRGLDIVDALATRWGSTADTSGTTVWFDLEP